MVYPAVVLLFAIAVVNILVFFILPKFSEIFQQIGIDLPTSTRLLLSVSRFMAHHWYLGPAMVAAGIFGLRFYRATPQGRRNVDWVLLKLPIAGDIILKVAVARFTRTLGTLTSSGLPVMHALEIVADTAGNQVISDAIHSAKRSVREGEGISDPLVVTGIFPPMVTQMIAVGEETGALDEMLVKVSQFYEAEVDRTLKALTSLIEPLMIIGLGLLVAFVAISVISPIYEMVGNASKL
jgi:type IV pilus assembly protein PilC